MTDETQPEPIEIIRRRFQQEWLLIAIEEMDQLTTIPLRGRLIAHSPTRDPLVSQLLSSPKPTAIPHSALRNPQSLLYLTRSDHHLPARHASAF